MCACFRGGGHAAAAGATVEDTVENTHRRVLEAIRRVRQGQ